MNDHLHLIPMKVLLFFVVPLALLRSTDAFTSRMPSFSFATTTTAAATTTIQSSTTHSSHSLLQRPRSLSLMSHHAPESAHGMPWKTTIGQSDHPDPLLYMPFWEWQMEYMKSELTNLKPDLTALSDFGYQENTQKKARIVSQCYKSQEYRKIRMTYYDAGDNTQVFNSVWYPDPKYNLPILGIDLLAFNRKKYLAIVDFQPLYSNEEEHAQTFSHRLAPIKSQYNSLKGQMSSKFYDETQFFSKQMLFARFEEEKVVHKDLFPAFKRYVMMHNRLVKETRPVQDPTEHEKVLNRHRAYDTYSAERDPATGLFAAMFGKEWADDYVFDFLFSMSERKQEEEMVVVMPVTNHGASVTVGNRSEAPSSSSLSSSTSSTPPTPLSSQQQQRMAVASVGARQ